MENAKQILVDIRELSNDILSQGFLTDDNLKSECDYKGWEVMSDNHTEATYLLDPKTGLELYCSPCFENDWGTIYFQINNIYGDNGFGECLNDPIVIDLTPYFGDIEKQKEIWRAKMNYIIDTIEYLVPNYHDIRAEHRVSEMLYQMYETKEFVDTMKHDKKTWDRIEFLKDCLITEFKKVKNKK